MDPAMALDVAAVAKNRALDEIVQKGDSDIQKFYSNMTVFITGGTGFMGKQLIEKILRACDISNIYILVRSKKGKIMQERINQMLLDPVFEPLGKQKPNFASKLIPVAGDVAEMRLGLNNEDWNTIVEKVDIIYHLAATTRFDETLRTATMINVRGAREVMLLARDCKRLKSFVHVSTAYTQALSSLVDQEVYEEFKPSPISPKALIAMAEEMEETRLNRITESLIEDYPNTYTFTKAVSEEIVRSMSDGLPLCIVRPGIVVATHRESVPGWLDISCAYGATGMLLGTGLGVLHVFLYNPDTKLGLVPCDYVNNVIIAAGREASRSVGGDTTKIYAVSSTMRNPLLYGYIREVIDKRRYDLASPKALYYNYGFTTNNWYLFTFLTWFIHFIPAYAVDFICLLLGQKRRLVKIYQKTYKMTNALSYFSRNTWLFDDKNTENLYKGLSKTDRTIFNFNITSLDWHEYIVIWCLGVRKYIVKDGLQGTNRAVKQQNWFLALHIILTGIYFYFIWKVLCLVYFVFSSVFSLASHYCN